MLSFVIIVCYAAGAWFVLRPLGLVDRSHLPICACGDGVQQVWFLELARVSFPHNLLSLHTALLDYPTGINLAGNPGFPLLGLAATPLTATIGPVGTFVLLVRLAFVISSSSAFFALKRWVHSKFAAGLGGAFYGFSPYMTHQAPVHVFLAFVPLPPLMLLIVAEETFRPRPGSAFRRGVLLGALAVAQYLIAAELLVTTALIAGLTLIVSATWTMARRSGWCRDAPRRLGRLMGGALSVIAPCLAYPAWYALFGPQRLVGPTQPVTSPGIDLLGAALPADRYLSAGGALGWHGPNIPLQGDMAFVGVPLLLCLGWVVIRFRHLPPVRAAAVVGLLAWLLALGPRLVVNGHVTHVPLPFALLTHVPLLQDAIPSRLTLYTDLAASVLLAFGVAGVIDDVRSAIRSTDPRAGAATPGRAAVTASLGAVVIAAALLPVLPLRPVPAASIGAAQQFADGPVAHDIKPGAVVLTFPYPSYPRDQAMLWQAQAGMRFALLGGYALRPDPNPALTKTPLPLAPAAVPALLSAPTGVDGPSAFVDAASGEVLGFLDRYHVTGIVVEASSSELAAAVVDMFSRILGAPTRDGSFDIWAIAANREAAPG